MKVIVVLVLFVVSLSEVEVRKQKQYGHHKQRHHSHNEDKSKTKNNREKIRKIHDRIYKKYAMFGAPVEESFAPSQLLTQQQQQPTQQIMVPVRQDSTSPEMVSSYSNTPTQPATTIGSEVSAAATQQQLVSPVGQPATTQYQTTDQTTLQQDGGGEQTGATSVNPSIDTSQGFSLQNTGKDGDFKGLEAYGGPLPESEQSKPQVEGVSPQEEVKVVNLGEDDQKAANAQALPCGGCPPGAKCVNGECQIREEEAQKLASKGTASNPESVSNLHNLETQELKTLLKEATNADPAPGSNLETSPSDTAASTEQTAALEGAMTSPEATAPFSEATTPPPGTATTPPGAATTSPGVTPTSPASTAALSQPNPNQVKQSDGTIIPTTTSSNPQQQTQTTFSETEIHELREFARMYKMYQFIRKMERKLNDPDCAPICRKICKPFCPAKCCRQQGSNKSNNNNGANTNLMDNVLGNFTSSVGVTKKPAAEHKLDASLTEDINPKEDDFDDENTARKKHIFVRIEKNNELDKPRSNIQ